MGAEWKGHAVKEDTQPGAYIQTQTQPNETGPDPLSETLRTRRFWNSEFFECGKLQTVPIPSYVTADSAIKYITLLQYRV